MNTAKDTAHRSAGKPAASSRAKAAATSKAARVHKGLSEAILAKIEAVRLAQRKEGSFDCFAKATGGYCDQGGCLYHADCLNISQLL